LIDWDPRHLYRRVFADEGDVERFLTDVCTPAWHAQHDAGRPMAKTIPELCAAHPHHADAIRLWHDRYEDMILGEIPGTVDVVRDLHETGVRLLILSNMPADVVGVLDRFEWMTLFEAVIVSGQEGLTKPDSAIFQILIDRHSLEPSSTMFVDDRPDNVAAAAAMGFQAIRFTDAQSLRTAMAGS
jgi:2-haloacid dehalogenase